MTLGTYHMECMVWHLRDDMTLEAQHAPRIMKYLNAPVHFLMMMMMMMMMIMRHLCLLRRQAITLPALLSVEALVWK